MERKRYRCPDCNVEMNESYKKKHATTKRHLKNTISTPKIPEPLASEECLICFEDSFKFTTCFCCKKKICVDCMNDITKTSKNHPSCPFCRTLVPIPTFFNASFTKLKEMIQQGFHPNVCNLAGRTLLFIESQQLVLRPHVIQYLIDIGAKY